MKNMFSQALPLNLSGSLGLAFKRFISYFYSVRGLIAIPFAWLIIFFFIPCLIVLKISLSESLVQTPPYSSLLQWSDHAVLTIRLYLNNYFYLFCDELYLYAFLNSIGIAAFSTFGCLLIGYPMAYGIARTPKPWASILILLVILPFWTSFLIRVYAWMTLLSPEGVINNSLMFLGFIKKPLQLLDNMWAVGVGIVYSYLPFMVLPIYAVLEKIEDDMLEASYDLGARPFQTLWKVTIPLSMPGIVAGSILVFIPAMGEFVIPDLLGGSDILMIGKLLWIEFFANRNWPVAGAVAIVMLVFIVIPLMYIQHLQSAGPREK